MTTLKYVRDCDHTKNLWNNTILNSFEITLACTSEADPFLYIIIQYFEI